MHGMQESEVLQSVYTHPNSCVPWVSMCQEGGYIKNLISHWQASIGM